MSNQDPQLRQAFESYSRDATINSFKVACLLGMMFVPAFSVIDFFVYPEHAREFLIVRLICAGLIGVFLAILLTPWGKKYYRFYGITLLMLPASSVSYMIFRTEGASSPYYAGLNLTMMVLGLILRWTLQESLIAMFLVLAGYILACSLHGPIEARGIFINNIYFLLSTGVIVVTGNHFYSRARYHEFAARYELDQNRRKLEESNRKLIELDQLKSRFFANVSHELRTPLTLLLAPLETLTRKYQDTLDPGGRELLTIMQSSGMRLLKLINDLLELIRLDSARLQVKNEPVALPEFISGLGSALRQLAINKRITLVIHMDPAVSVILGDRDKLEKILLNLLSNALKFTPAAGFVRLHVEKQKEELVFIVSDTGMGIAEKSLPFVFDRFWQEDGSSKRKFQGVGIGLALVKELTEIQEGTVAVQSREGEGATFTVRLPYRLAPPGLKVSEPPTRDESQADDEWLVNLYHRAELFPVTASQPAANGSATFTRRTQRPLVMVADDEPDMRRFLVSQLGEDYEVIEAVDGRDAAEKARAVLPDVILLDLMMPHMDGLQVCRELRAHAPTSGIPIILLTARADEEAKFDALQKGANDFLAKPFSSAELQARVKNLIEHHRYQYRLTRQNEALSNAIEQIKETELQLVQSEKLSALGRLSAGIIHEINNPLNYSLTGLFALRNKGKELSDGQRAEFEAIVGDVEEGLKRVRNIVSDLRTFTHPGGGEGELVEVPRAVDAALRFLTGEWHNQVAIHQNLPPGLSLWANHNRLIQVFVNLLQNAIDALREKQFTGGEQPQIWIDGRQENDRTLIVVRDNGPGIDAKNADKIFDPFFTTKEVGKGMGLGLSICYRIVQGYGGRISVRSAPGKFCEFTLYLPTTAQAAAKTVSEHVEPI